MGSLGFRGRRVQGSKKLLEGGAPIFVAFDDVRVRSEALPRGEVPLGGDPDER
jgi:hypothetical protein